MWLKEEFMGLEECFKMTHLILDFFAKAMLEERDSSIEQYLLNFWSKDLSLRDTVDRIQTTVRFAGSNQADTFNILFTWLIEQKLQQQPTDWSLEDFRKIANFIAKQFLHKEETTALNFVN